MKKRGRRAYEDETTRIHPPRTYAALVSEQDGPELAWRFCMFLKWILLYKTNGHEKIVLTGSEWNGEALEQPSQASCAPWVAIFLPCWRFYESAILQDAMKMNLPRRQGKFDVNIWTGWRFGQENLNRRRIIRTKRTQMWFDVRGLQFSTKGLVKVISCKLSQNS